MKDIQTIDVRGLDHDQKQQTIFPALDKLVVGGSLRIVFDFNPLPLVHMLKAGQELDLSFDKEGPHEWILSVRRTSPPAARKEQLKKLMQELKSGEISAEAKERAKELFQNVDAMTLGLVEQELIREGVSHEEIRKNLCDIHLEALRDSLVAKRIEVDPPHPVHTFMEEHKIILDSLKTLAGIVERLKDAGDYQAAADDIETLKDVAHHLVEAESHHDREEQCLFPALQAHDIVEPTEIMKLDHVEFRKRKQELYKIAHNHEDLDFAAFKSKVIELGQYLSVELDSHIFKEDNILYQIALQILTDDDWKAMKKEADKIGYCCFTPQDHQKVNACS